MRSQRIQKHVIQEKVRVDSSFSSLGDWILGFEGIQTVCLRSPAPPFTSIQTDVAGCFLHHRPLEWFFVCFPGFLATNP
jgi:hypothetical protein